MISKLRWSVLSMVVMVIGCASGNSREGVSPHLLAVAVDDNAKDFLRLSSENAPPFVNEYVKNTHGHKRISCTIKRTSTNGHPEYNTTLSVNGLLPGERRLFDQHGPGLTFKYEVEGAGFDSSHADPDEQEQPDDKKQPADRGRGLRPQMQPLPRFDYMVQRLPEQPPELPFGTRLHNLLNAFGPYGWHYEGSVEYKGADGGSDTYMILSRERP